MVCCARFLLRHWSESKNRFSTMGLQNSSTVGIAHSKIREHKVIEHWTAQYKNTLRRICPKKSFELKWTRVFWLGGKTGHLHTHLGKFWWLKIRHSSPQDVFFSFPQQNTWPVVVSNEKVAKTLNLMRFFFWSIFDLPPKLLPTTTLSFSIFKFWSRVRRGALARS